QVDVLAELGIGELEALAHGARVELAVLARGVDEDPGQRDEPGEALGADRRLLPAIGVWVVALRLGTFRTRRGGWLKRVLVALDDQREPLRGLLRQLGRAENPGALAEPEHPRHH